MPNAKNSALIHQFISCSSAQNIVTHLRDWRPFAISTKPPPQRKNHLAILFQHIQGLSTLLTSFPLSPQSRLPIKSSNDPPSSRWTSRRISPRDTCQPRSAAAAYLAVSACASSALPLRHL